MGAMHAYCAEGFLVYEGWDVGSAGGGRASRGVGFDVYCSLCAR